MLLKYSIQCLELSRMKWHFWASAVKMSSPVWGLISWNLHWMWWIRASGAKHPGYRAREHIPAMTNAALVDTNWIIQTQRHWAGWEKDHWFVFWCPSFMLRDNDNSKGETEVTIYHPLQRAINQHFCFPFVYLWACATGHYRAMGAGEGGLFQSWLDQCATVNLSDSVQVVKIEESAARSEELLSYSTHYCNIHRPTDTGQQPNSGIPLLSYTTLSTPQPHLFSFNCRNLKWRTVCVKKICKKIVAVDY